ncbi:MAG: hypothetical protein HZB38_11545 [Planctomycetes bacterium]|nr:hypothetical protein [Planctomycetota bacterium]
MNKWRRISALACVCFGVNSLAWSEDAVAASSADERVQQLEERIAASSRRLEELTRLAGADETAQVDKQRIEALKQQIREVLSEQEFRSSLMPSAVTAGYDGGFYIGSSDEKFLLKFNGMTQVRFTHYGTRSDNRYLLPRFERDDRTGFDVARIRLMLTGYAYSKDLTYNITIRADSPDAYDSRIHYAYVNYRFADEFQVRAGVFRLASTRQQVQSDANFQFVDRSMFDAVYGLGIGTGVRFWGKLFDKRLEWFIDVVNSLNSPASRTITPDPAEQDNTPALLARLVWHALGDEPGKDFALDPDLQPHQNPALDFGFHYAFTDDQGDRNGLRIPYPLPRSVGRGGFGLTRSLGLQIHQFGFESAFKWQGFSASGEYVVRVLDPRRAGRRPYTPLWLLTGEDSTVAQHGAYVQAGYFLPIPGLENKLEVAARIGGISTLAEGHEGSWEYTGCVNYYIHGNNVKLNFEVTKIQEAPISSAQNGLANVNDDALEFRVQMQVAF